MERRTNKRKRIISIGDTVYTISTERYGYPILCECVVEGEGNTMLLYAIEENRSFYREMTEVLTKEELSLNIFRLFGVEI